MSDTDIRNDEWSFGWREVVVVLFVLFLGVVLVLPSIQQSVPASRESWCRNNLKNLGLALHNYHQFHGTFPPGAVRSSRPEDNSAYSWHVMILPYLDKKELYEKLSPNQQYSLREALGQEELQSIAKSTNENFVCPVDASLDEENPDRLLDPGGLDFSAARANYVASTGVTRTAGQGVFFLHSRIRFRDIKDGSSNVFLLGERTSGDAANTGRHGASVWIGVTATKAWDAGLPSDAESTLYGTTAVEMQTGKKLTGRPGFAPRLGFSSDHTWRNKAACFLMADGTVKKINPDIDSRIGKDPSDTDGWGVYQLLSSRSDGKRIPESAFRNR